MTLSIRFDELNNLMRTKGGIDSIRFCGVDSDSFKIIYTHTTVIPIIRKEIKKDVELQFSVYSASFSEVVFRNECGPLFGKFVPLVVKVLGRWIKWPEIMKTVIIDGSYVRVNLDKFEYRIPALVTAKRYFTLDDAFATAQGFTVKLFPKL